MLFTDGIFSPHELGDPRAAEVLYAATDRAAGQVRTSDLLYAVIASASDGVRSALTLALADGTKPKDLLDGISVYSPARQDGPDFDGRRDRFAADALDILDKFDDELAAYPAQRHQVGLELLAARVLEQLGDRDRRYLPILNAERAAHGLREQVRIAVEPPRPLLDEATGRLKSEEFSERSWAALNLAADRASELGYDLILPPHCLLGLLGETEGLTEQLIRRQIPPQVGLVKVAASITDAFRISSRRQDTPALPLSRDAIGETLMTLLHAAQRTAAISGAEHIDTPHLLGALLDTMPPRLQSVLQTAPLNLDLPRMRTQLGQALRDAVTAPRRETAFRLPAGLPPSEDLTWLARSEELPAALHLDRYFDPLMRALHRTTANHVLITGLPGVGTTTLLRELARRAAAGEIPFLRRKRFLYVDCRDVTPASSGATLNALISQVSGRTDLITCIDGLGSLLRGERDDDHRLILRSALKDRRIHLIGVFSRHDYEDVIGPDQALVELTTRIDVEEPGQAEARDMAAQAAAALSAEFGVRIEADAVGQAVSLASDFILSERLPAKAIRVLRRACEDLCFRREETGAEQEAVGAEDVVAVIAEISGVPASQISGTGGERIDFERSLGELVVGQPDAVRVVAAELRRIKAGLSGAGGRPASVMFFAGLTGVGKTELAKTIARFYSSSKRLQTYPMENFTEHHSVSGILGSPPGYVGYEQGGRLINDLNADPYAVFLLDEAEKAHPDVWRPFLNLFDEGWIEDRRGTRAFADRAIFILTSNAGHEIIARLSERGRPADEIAEAVRENLRSTRHQSSGQLVFPPEFLSRIRQIIVFRPLDHAAMAGITRNRVEAQRRFWRDRRGKELVIPEALVEHIADRGHRENEAAGGSKGGRIVETLVSELVENPIVLANERWPDEYQRASRIELSFRRSRDPAVEVTFRDLAAPGPDREGDPE